MRAISGRALEPAAGPPAARERLMGGGIVGRSEDAGRLGRGRFRGVEGTPLPVLLGLRRFACLFGMGVARRANSPCVRWWNRVARLVCRAKRCFAGLFVSGVGTRVSHISIFPILRKMFPPGLILSWVPWLVPI